MNDHINDIKERVAREVEVLKQVLQELRPEEIAKIGGMNQLLDRVKSNITDSINWSLKKGSKI